MCQDRVLLLNFGTQFKDHAVATCQTEVSADGFDVIRLRNACISVTIMPELGGKIYQITDLRTGRDWLWKNPYIALRQPSPGLDYEKELDTGGWDEVLFSVKPCRLKLPGNRSMSIGDHGLVVDKAWHEIETGIHDSGAAVCELLVEGQSPDFKFQRRIILHADQPRFDIEYTLSNTGSSSWPWLWCVHPLLAIKKGMYIDLPRGQKIRSVHEGITGSVTDQVWPNVAMPNGETHNLAKVFDHTNGPGVFNQKLYVQSTKRVCLSTADTTESFSISYDPESLPWLGLWINNNAWSGCGSEPYLNLGLEPTTTPYDSLADAVEFDDADVLEPGESKKWRLAVSLDNKVNTNA